jgi:hypothetical protein
MEYDKLTRERLAFDFSLLVLALVIAASLACIFKYSPGDEATALAQTLATAQATLFAIVFSVIILAAQLSTGQYAPRMADLIGSDGSFLKTAGLFIGSIGTDVFMIYSIGGFGDFASRALMYFAGILAGLSVYGLILHTKHILRQTTPEGVWDRLSRSLEPESVTIAAREADNNPSNPDPYTTPVSVLRSLISERDEPAIELGFNVITDQTTKLIQSTPPSDLDEGTPISRTISTLLEQRLPHLTVMSTDEDQPTVAKKSSKSIRIISIEAAHTSLGALTLSGIRGTTSPISDIRGDDTGYQVRSNCERNSREIVEVAAEEGLHKSAGEGSLLTSWRIASSIGKYRNIKQVDAAATNYLLRLHSRIQATQDNTNATSLSGISWSSPQPRNSPNGYSSVKALRDYYVSFTEVAGEALRVEVDVQDTIINWNSISAGLGSILSRTEKCPSPGYHHQWVAVAIYLQYIRAQTSNSVMAGYSFNGRNFVQKEDHDKTIGKLLNGDIPIEDYFSFVRLQDPTVIRKTGTHQQVLQNPSEEFSEWLKIRARSAKIGYII